MADVLAALDEDRKERVRTGKGREVHPREEIMVPTPERRQTKVKADVDDRIPTAVSLQAADEIWSENKVSWGSAHYRFADVSIEPKPLGGPVPFWYCGATPASARRAVDCDGWMPGRIGLATFRARVETMRELSTQQGKPMPMVAVIPPTSIEASREEALVDVNIPGLLDWANKAKFSVKPASGRFETWEDLEGQLLAGDPDDVVAECRKFEEAGNDHLVFDFRFKFHQWYEQLELLGSEVLPKLQPAAATG